MSDLKTRAADAATSVERLERALVDGTDDPVVVAYVRRAAYAAAMCEERMGEGVEPDSAYLGRLRPSMRTTIERYS